MVVVVKVVRSAVVVVVLVVVVKVVRSAVVVVVLVLVAKVRPVVVRLLDQRGWLWCWCWW